VYTRRDISIEDRLEIFSLYQRFGHQHGYVTQLARQWGVSRHFIYDLASRVREAARWGTPGRKLEDRLDDEVARLRQRVRELEADCETLRGELEIERRDRVERRNRLLLELALCPISERKIARCLAAAFGYEPSQAVIHEQIEQAGAAALRLMQSEEVRLALTEAALDEIFSGGKPILTIVEPQSMMALVPEATGNRQGMTWSKVLEQYPNLQLAISDQGSGLLKGVTLRSGIEHQADLFHFKRSLHREVRRVEAQCYDAIAALDTARRLIERPRLLDTARIQARVEYREKAEAVDRKLLAFDWLELAVGYVEEQLEPFNRLTERLRSHEEARRAIEDALRLLDSMGEIEVKPIVTIIENASEHLLTFLRVLDRRLQAIEVRWRKVAGSNPALFSAIARVWYWRSRWRRSEGGVRQYLIALIALQYWERRMENLGEVVERVFDALERVVRASSVVESLNSIIRPYTSVKKRLSQRYLALIAFYWNCHSIPQRGGRTPFEVAGVDLGSDDWVELIEREMQRMKVLPAVIN
jgi:tetratricopeptide (TPR) repeat protein